MNFTCHRSADLRLVVTWHCPSVPDAEMHSSICQFGLLDQVILLGASEIVRFRGKSLTWQADFWHDKLASRGTTQLAYIIRLYHAKRNLQCAARSGRRPQDWRLQKVRARSGSLLFKVGILQSFHGGNVPEIPMRDWTLACGLTIL